MRTTWRRLTATGCVIAAVAWTPVARAQSNKATAEALFEEGRKLIAQKNPAQACPKFAESQRLDPSPSTLLNLGSCYERVGKSASAWATYREAASLANAQSRADLMAVAQRHAAAVEPELARLVITPSAPVDGLAITLQGQLLGRGAWEVPVPVDPGVITIEASAPKKKKWSSEIDVSQPGKTVTLTIPALEDGPPQPQAPTTTSAEINGPASSDSGGLVPHRVAWQKPAALVAGVVGIAGLALGTVFVLSAKSKYDNSLAKCPVNNDRCTSEGVSMRDDARHAGNMATVAYAAGAVSLGAGAVLFLTAPRSEQSRTSAQLHLAPSLGGMTMVGQW